MSNRKPVTFDRPPREDYVRATVDAHGYTLEPAVEFRAGDGFEKIAYLLRTSARRIAHGAWNSTIDSHASEFVAIAPGRQGEWIRELMPDSMSIAKALGEEIAKRWPDRAYFVEVWQDGREGFAQVFQPFGLPRNR